MFLCHTLTFCHVTHWHLFCPFCCFYDVYYHYKWYLWHIRVINVQIIKKNYKNWQNILFVLKCVSVWHFFIFWYCSENVDLTCILGILYHKYSIYWCLYTLKLQILVDLNTKNQFYWKRQCVTQKQFLCFPGIFESVNDRVRTLKRCMLLYGIGI